MWLAAAALSWRRAAHDLRVLHVTLGGVALLGAASMTRIIGPPWPYLTLWAWSLTVLVVGALVWCVATLARPAAYRMRSASGDADSRSLYALAGFAVATWTTVSFADADIPGSRISRTTDALVGPTEAALSGPSGLDGVISSRAQIRVFDAVDMGSVAFGLFNELDRRGFDVLLEPQYRNMATAHRVGPPPTGGTQVVVASGMWIDRWRSISEAVEIAYYDPA